MLKISASSLSAWDQCHRLFFWRYKRGYSPVSIYMPFFEGGIVHEGIAMVLDSIQKGKLVKKGALVETEVLRIVGWVGDEVERRLVGADWEVEKIQVVAVKLAGLVYAYIKNYAVRDCVRREYLGIERKIEATLKVHTPSGQTKYTGVVFNGILDVLFTNKKTGEIWFEDHKIVQHLDEHVREIIFTDTQVQLYYMMLKANKATAAVRGVVYDQVAKPQIKLTKRETVADFLERLAVEYKANTQKYFFREEIALTPGDAKGVMVDIAGAVDELAYYMPSDDIESYRRTRYTRNCHTPQYRCPFIALCKYGERRDVLSQYCVNKKQIKEITNAGE